MYHGKTVSVSLRENGVAALCFDAKDANANVFNALTRAEAAEAIAVIAQSTQVSAVMVYSAKSMFIAGADIVEFAADFQLDDEQFSAVMRRANSDVFNAMEDLPVPTVAAIHGFALGGGLELALACDYRIATTDASLGLPETSLGIIPGYGGTVRLPRLVGADTALEWICSARHYSSSAALKAGVVDAVVVPEKLQDAAMALLQRCLSGDEDFRQRRQEKLQPLGLNTLESEMVFDVAQKEVVSTTGAHYPAPVAAVEVLRNAAGKDRDAALLDELSAILALRKTAAATNLIGIFLGDQHLKKTAKAVARESSAIARTGVLGAGIMGGGIAYQTALKGLPVIMKDVAQAGIDLGLNEASNLLSKQLASGRISAQGMAATLNHITPSLNYDGFADLDVVVEAVVENVQIKQRVLREAEDKLKASAVLASNTSTLSIDLLAEPLARPENFCGMHFFNPVHLMPLVEVIRGSKTSDETVATVVNYALAMGKKPVVVNNCAGFLVNRVLFPYFIAFYAQVNRGQDFLRIDRVMEAFGWPMGPAQLLDVIGLDTIAKAEAPMVASFPDRMASAFSSATAQLLAADRLGQKNGKGYYLYERDHRGRLKKRVDSDVSALLVAENAAGEVLADADVVDLLMVPMCLEAVRCLEEGIAESATDVDMAMVHGIGFPRFLGGPLRYIEEIGIAAFVEKADQLSRFGGLYGVSDGLRDMAANGKTFY